ncbi:DUF3967 domain-containing protein [Bacillus cereus]|uniref:DUF3967 domain-containing protein n=1 Tax=Bacillus cereus TaxID=1396 RepID=UPI000BFB54DF|nr:hypothetical protein CN927_20740 [Bacillus cereus]
MNGMLNELSERRKEKLNLMSLLHDIQETKCLIAAIKQKKSWWEFWERLYKTRGLTYRRNFERNLRRVAEDSRETRYYEYQI